MDNQSSLMRMAKLVIFMTDPTLPKPQREQVEILARALAKDCLKKAEAKV